MTWLVLTGDSAEQLRALPDASIDAVVTDPPYGLSKEPDALEVLRHWLAGDDYEHRGSGFMGKSWDSFVPGPSIWREVLRVLKPGGHACVFAGSRTVDLMGLSLRIAGFEIRDQLQWLYGTGFPKSLNVSKAIDKAAGAEREVLRPRTYEQTDGGGYSGGLNTSKPRSQSAEITAPATDDAKRWDGWGTALKPAHEPIVLARKPMGGTVAANVLEHGTGALNIEACRIGSADKLVRPEIQRNDNAVLGTGLGAGEQTEPGGRWPANAVLDPEAGAMLDEQSGTSKSGVIKPYTEKHEDPTSYGFAREKPAFDYADSGGASRFFFTADETDEQWLDRNLIPYSASSAGPFLCLQDETAASALAHAATRALPGVTASSVSQAPTTPATPNESRRLVESSTAAIQSIGGRFWHASPPTSITVTHGRATCVVARPQIGITTITIDRWRSDGSVDPVTFKSTCESLDPGDPASRFRYCAKTSKREREAGLDHMRKASAGELTGGRAEGSDGLKNPRAGAGRTSSGRANVHPTVKPIELMRWLVRLVTPPGGTVLDPFAGSGSTGCACALEGVPFLGVELSEEYAEIARARIRHWTEQA